MKEEEERKKDLQNVGDAQMQPDLSIFLPIYTQKEIKLKSKAESESVGRKNRTATRVGPVHLDFFIVPRQFGPRSSKSRPGRFHLGPCGFNASRQVF